MQLVIITHKVEVTIKVITKELRYVQSNRLSSLDLTLFAARRNPNAENVGQPTVRAIAGRLRVLKITNQINSANARRLTLIFIFKL